MNPRSASGGAPSAAEILAFWFGDDPSSAAELGASMKRWFAGGPACDGEIAARFGPALEAAAAGELDAWAADAHGRLALILLLDQFPRAVHRGHARAFAQDSVALGLSVTGIATGLDRALTPLQCLFFYMPMQHAESLEIQQQSVAAFDALAERNADPILRDALEGAADYARQHRDIIAQFGRFPHRNAALGRVNSPKEATYLERGAPKFGQ